jgi:hypothetical protein
LNLDVTDAALLNVIRLGDRLVGPLGRLHLVDRLREAPHQIARDEIAVILKDNIEPL